jgi:hypothetical protein
MFPSSSILCDAIYNIEKFAIGAKDIVILCPYKYPDYLWKEIYNTSGSTDLGFSVFATKEHRNSFYGILVIEDPSINTLVVKSLISSHRVEIRENEQTKEFELVKNFLD